MEPTSYLLRSTMLNKTTKLQAVNTMLSVIGEPPINTLSSQRADSVLAEQILDEVSREIQSYGWHFNTEDKVVLTPDSDGYIYISENVARVDLDPNVYSELDIVLRGNRLYEKVSNSYVFSASITVTRIVMLDFEEMPEPARRYIMIRASRIFGDRMIGSEKHHMFTGQDEIVAMAKMSEYETDTGDYSIFDNYSTASVINRNAQYRTY
jgi:hypothetical protein